MRGWRSKLVFILVVYFIGFATAIYTLAPVPEKQKGKLSKNSFKYSALKSDEFAQSFNTGMHKCLDFGKDFACRMGKIIKQKFDDRQSRAKS
ncbi:MAG: hypothetical protein FVQ85_13305 [Planctomycetes bacterium]|nr:hypothetical protein [Planctomycetota bacterium]